MKNYQWVCSLCLSVLSALAFAIPRVPSAFHVEMSANLHDGIEWAKRLNEEVKKGAKMDPTYLAKGTDGTRAALDAMHLTASKILTEAPSELTEEHFLKMRDLQQAADKAAYDLANASRGKKPDYKKMQAAAKIILKNLNEAKHFHDMELSEFDRSLRK